MLKEVELPGSGIIDLVGIDADGNIYIIETKLAKNPEAKREVIGQVLEFAAFLQDKEISWIEEITLKQTQSTIVQHFEKAPDWDISSFMQNLQDNLKNGTFKLFIVVDRMNPALQKTINRMKDHGEEIYALELNYFNNKTGTEILVPNVHGKRQQTASLLPRAPWTEESFFEAAEKYLKDDKTQKTLKRLYDFSKQVSGGKVDFGAGRSIGTFKLHLLHRGSWETLCVISYVPQFTWFAFKEMIHHGVNRVLISDYIRELNLLGFQLGNEKDAEHDRQLNLSVLNDQEKFEAFKKHSIELRDKFSQTS